MPLRDIDVFWLGAVAKAIATAGTYPYVSLFPLCTCVSAHPNAYIDVLSTSMAQIVIKSRLVSLHCLGLEKNAF